MVAFWVIHLLILVKLKFINIKKSSVVCTIKENIVGTGSNKKYHLLVENHARKAQCVGVCQ